MGCDTGCGSDVGKLTVGMPRINLGPDKENRPSKVHWATPPIQTSVQMTWLSAATVSYTTMTAARTSGWFSDLKRTHKIIETLTK